MKFQMRELCKDQYKGSPWGVAGWLFMLLRQRERRGAHIMRPCQFSGSATPCGLVPIAAIRLHVGGGAPYASMGTRALRVDMESAPTSAESFGPGGGKRKPQINQLSATATRYL